MWELLSNVPVVCSNKTSLDLWTARCPVSVRVPFVKSVEEDGKGNKDKEDGKSDPTHSLLPWLDTDVLHDSNSKE